MQKRRGAKAEAGRPASGAQSDLAALAQLREDRAAAAREVLAAAAKGAESEGQVSRARGGLSLSRGSEAGVL